MTNKERLEMIKHDFEERGQYGGFIDDYDTQWLIKQAEKVERYEKTLTEIVTKLGWREVECEEIIKNSLND